MISVKIMGKISLYSLLKWIACVGYGSTVGYLAITAAEIPPGLTDNSSYQNFGIIVGAIVGLSICIIAHILYLIWKRRTKSERQGFLFVLCIATGVVIGFVSSYIVHVSADSYGLTDASMSAIVIGSLIPAIVGGLLPAVILMIIEH
jgi:hypothetical protein